MIIYRMEGMIESGDGAKNILQVYSTLLMPELRRAWRRSLAQEEKKGCNREGRMNIGGLALLVNEGCGDTAELALSANEAHMKIPVPSTNERGASVVVVLAAELVRSKASRRMNPGSQGDSACGR